MTAEPGPQILNGAAGGSGRPVEGREAGTTRHNPVQNPCCWTLSRPQLEWTAPVPGHFPESDRKLTSSDQPGPRLALLRPTRCSRSTRARDVMTSLKATLGTLDTRIASHRSGPTLRQSAISALSALSAASHPLPASLLFSAQLTARISAGRDDSREPNPLGR